MEYSGNPFCILALAVNASPRQMVARFDELTTAARVGLAPVSFRDPSWAGPVRRSVESIEQARQRLEQPRLCAVDALHWYWSVAPGAARQPVCEPLLESHYIESARASQAALRGTPTPAQRIALLVDFSLALRLALATEVCRHMRLFSRLGHLITCHIDIGETLRRHPGVLPREFDREAFTHALRDILGRCFASLRHLPALANAGDDEARDCRVKYERCVHLLTTHPPFAALADEFVPLPVYKKHSDESAPQPLSENRGEEAPRRAARGGFLRGLWQLLPRYEEDTSRTQNTWEE